MASSLLDPLVDNADGAEQAADVASEPAAPDELVALGPAEDGNGSDEGELEDVARAAEERVREALLQIDLVRRAAVASRTRLQAEITVQRRLAARTKEQLLETEAALAQTRDAFEEQRVTAAELTTVLQAVEHRLSNLESLVAEREGELRALEERRAEENEEARLQKVQLEEELRRLAETSSTAEYRWQVRVQELEEERVAAVAESEGLRKRLSKQEAELDLLRNQLARSADVCRALEAQIAEFHGRAGPEMPSGELRQKVGELEGEIARMRERAEVRLVELQRLEAYCRDLEEELAEREHRCVGAEKERDALRVTANREREEASRRESEYAELQRLHDALRQDRDALAGRVGEDGQRAMLAEERCAEAEARLAELQAAEVLRQQAEVELREALERAEEQNQASQSEVAALRTEVQSQARLRDSLEAEVNAARGRVGELEVRLHAETQKHMVQLAKSTDRMRVLEVERDSARDQVAALVEAKEKLQRELDQLKRRLETEQHRVEMSRLQARLEEIGARHPAVRRRDNDGSEAGTPAEGTRTRKRLPLSLGFPADTPIVAIGASTGGPAVLAEILGAFPADFPACILVVQHMPRGYTEELASCLDQQVKLVVMEARKGDLVQPGVVLVAPGGEHLEVHHGRIRLSEGELVNKHRPSVDVLFDSLIPVARRVFAVLLTGMGSDGAAGMSRLHAAGARTIVQDEKSSVVWGMPEAAARLGCADRQLPPIGIARYLKESVSELLLETRGEVVVGTEVSEIAVG